MSNLTKILLGLIIILSLVLRVYKIDSVPPSISWDEAAVGYNAWTIANYGRDEYGKFLPLYFRSFGEDKNPVDIYITAIFVKTMGLNELSIRLPSVLFGVLDVLMIFFLARILFKNDQVGLIAALFLAISPYNLHFSHFNHEANLALFFFMLGVSLFILGLKKSSWMLSFSMISFCLAFISYNPPKLIVPLVILMLVCVYAKQLIKSPKKLIAPVVILVLFITLIFFNQNLLAGNRISQTIQGNADIEKTQLFKMTHNELLGRVNLALTQYSWHFTPKFLFISGDKNPVLSSQSNGEFYLIDGLFLISGVVFLVWKRSREGLLLLGIALIAPLPSALTAEAPHAGRAMFMMGSWNLISAFGSYSLLGLFKKLQIKWVIMGITVVILSFSLKNYLTYYYVEYAKRYAIDWQYGMKQIVSYVKAHPEYAQVYMTDARSQPYIFFLYYLQTPLPEYLNSVIYNNNKESNSFSNVTTFGRFYFEGWDPIESTPQRDVLYIVTPSQYDGLRHKAVFKVEKKIDYPNGLDAFYLVGIN